jgi:hypothetical protein
MKQKLLDYLIADYARTEVPEILDAPQLSPT